MTTNQAGDVEINTHATAANVARAVSINKQENNIGAAQSSWENSNNQVHHIINHNYAVPTPWPQSSTIARGLNRSLPPDAAFWSYEQGRLVSQDEHARQRDTTLQGWNKTLPILQAVDRSIKFFESQYDLDIHDNEKELEQIKRSTQKALKRARDACRCHSKLEDGISTVLRRLDKDLTAFFSWLSCLYHEEHGCSLCSKLEIPPGAREYFSDMEFIAAIRTILASVGEDEAPPIPAIKLMAGMISKFSTRTEYSRTKKTVRRTMNETVEAFEHVANFLIDVLNNGKTPMKEEKVEDLELRIQNLAAVLRLTSSKARSIDKVYPDDRSIGNIPQTSGHLQIYIYNAQLSLHAGSDLRIERHREGLLLKDLDKETQQGVLKCISSLKSDEELSISDLSRHLMFEETTLERDLERCSSLSVVKQPRMIQRLSTLTRRPAFQSWLSETSQASAILIHGNFQIRTVMTPLSHLCARISREYTGKQGFMVVNYFCALHANTRTEDSDAKAMLSSLVGQLLSHPIMDENYKSGSFDKHIIKGVKKRDIHALGKLLKALVNQLQSTSIVVFCLIDSISYYEDPVRAKDTKEALSFLKEIVVSQRKRRRKDAERFVFKLMVTAGTKSVNAYRCFNREDILEMNESVDGNERLKIT